jgi:hypothetical protein
MTTYLSGFFLKQAYTWAPGMHALKISMYKLQQGVQIS